MRTLNAMVTVGGLAAALCLAPARAAEETFDACDVFTQADAESAMGTAAAPEPVNPKAKKPKVVPTCTYNGFKEGKAIEAKAQFRFGKTDGEAQRAFDDHRLQVQTKPILIAGSDGSFWSAKTGQMNIRKGRIWVTVSVGGPKLSERDSDQAKKLAELLVKKL